METRDKPAVPSILSKNLHITGNLETDGEIHVEGIVDGDVKARTLTIAVDSVVNGSIEGETIRVDGTVNGQITGVAVELGKTARVNGDILHECLAVEAGAFVHGLCKNTMGNGQRSDPATVKPNLVVAGSEEEDAVNL